MEFIGKKIAWLVSVFKFVNAVAVVVKFVSKHMNEKFYQSILALRVEKATAFYLVNDKIKFRRRDRLLIMNFSYMSTWC